MTEKQKIINLLQRVEEALNTFNANVSLIKSNEIKLLGKTSLNPILFRKLSDNSFTSDLLKLSGTTQGCIKRADEIYFWQLIYLKKSDIMGWKFAGKKAISEIEEFVTSKGYCLSYSFSDEELIFLKENTINKKAE